jgi:hypothetical protein
MQIGIDSFGAVISDPATGLALSPVQRMQNLLEEIELADQVGLDVFGIGGHHRAEFLDSAAAVILSAAAFGEGSVHECDRHSFPANGRTDALDAAGILLMTIPNTLGVEYNAYAIESVLKCIAPQSGRR